MRRMPTTTNLVGVGRHRGSPGSMSGGGRVSGLVTRDLLARQSLQTLRPRPATLRRHSDKPRSLNRSAAFAARVTVWCGIYRLTHKPDATLSSRVESL